MTKKSMISLALIIILALMGTAAASADGYCNCGSSYSCYNGSYNCSCYPYQPVARDSAYFVADVTIPDGSYVAPGSYIIKTWRIRNNGTTTWDSSYKLVFVSGNQMGAPASSALPCVVAPGQTVDISVSLIVPSESGSYKGEWMLENGSGIRFGVNANAVTPIWVSLVNYYQQPIYNYNNCYNNYCSNCWNNCWDCGVPGFDHDGDYNPVPRPQPHPQEQPQPWPVYRPY